MKRSHMLARVRQWLNVCSREEREEFGSLCGSPTDRLCPIEMWDLGNVSQAYQTVQDRSFLVSLYIWPSSMTIEAARALGELKKGYILTQQRNGTTTKSGVEKLARMSKRLSKKNYTWAIITQNS